LFGLAILALCGKQGAQLLLMLLINQTRHSSIRISLQAPNHEQG